jgi:chaperonin GroEL
MPSFSRLHFGDEGRARVLAGARTLTDALRDTLGPRARSVLIGKRWDAPLVCDDGVTIAKAIKLENPEEDLGAQLLRQAAVRTGELVGDGTTTSTLLAHALLADGVRNIVAGASGVELHRGLELALEAAVADLRAIARPVSTAAEKAQVATVSAHGDAGIGKLVADAIERVGAEGVVSVEEAKGTETSVEVVEGMMFERGWLSPYFITNPSRQEAVLEDVAILLHDRRIGTMVDLVPLLEGAIRDGRSMLIVAEDVDGEALATLVVNRLRGALQCAAVKAPGFGDRRKALLQDLAVVTGGRVISEELGTKLANVSFEDLGRAKRVVVGRDSTTIVGGAGEPAAIAERCAELRGQLAEAKSDYDREKLQERLGKLTGGVALVRVGSPSEAETRMRKEAIEDAISATQAAIAEGVVAGGGTALVHAIEAIERVAREHDGDVRTGALILRRALEVPLRQLAVNVGVDPGVAVDRVRELGLGLDAARGEYVDLLARGIVDPVKVVRIGLQNAVSVAATMLRAQTTLTEHEVTEGDAGAGPGPEPG